jgi:thiamine pyrophosphokinase
VGATNRFLIFVGGEPVPLSRFEGLVPHSILVACDSGISTLLRNGLSPDFFLGDLDSVNPDVVLQFKGKIKGFFQFPIPKDKTDSELGVDLALKENAEEIIIIGGLGERLDHTLSNILLLLKIHQAGVKGQIIGAKERIFLLPDLFELEAPPGSLFSLIPLGRVVSINILGARFPLEDGEMVPGSTLGISNIIEGGILRVKKQGGPLFLVLLDAC